MLTAEAGTCKPDHSEPLTVRVNVSEQCLELVRNQHVEKRYPVSTSRFGLGFEEGSFRTPTGRFRISEKIGEGAPSYAVFRGRVPTGEIAEQGGEEDLVLTRILWLDGLDPENSNTKARYVYIHGTNQEACIGQPASHGCVRMRNADLLELFDTVEVGTRVTIG